MKRCLDCGVDISERGNRAERCKPCADERNRKARLASAKLHNEHVKGTDEQRCRERGWKRGQRRRQRDGDSKNI